MKTIIIIILIATGLISCGGDKIKDFMPGTYVRDVDNEFYKGTDTLVISETGNAGNNYSIVKIAAFRRIVNGQLQHRIRHTSLQTTGTYDAQQKMLHEKKYGAAISFDPDKNLLLWNAGRYYKLK